jgi:predicted RNA-binding protein with PUA-like domain
MAYWLMKSEPDVFSIEDLEKQKRSGWDGVRNYQARNYMRDGMKLGDLILFYHSNAEPSGIAGIAKVSKEAHPDPSQFEKKSEYFDPKATKEKPIWLQVEVEFVKKFNSVLSLEKIKKEKSLSSMPLVQKGTRLSVMPVAEQEWNTILSLAEK